MLKNFQCSEKSLAAFKGEKKKSFSRATSENGIGRQQEKIEFIVSYLISCSRCLSVKSEIFGEICDTKKYISGILRRKI